MNTNDGIKARSEAKAKEEQTTKLGLDVHAGQITVCRQQEGSVLALSHFMLVTAMNPCPCGYFGVQGRKCRCSTGEAEKYRSRIPVPLLALIDIQVEAPAVNFRELSSSESGEPSSVIRVRVAAAHRIQKSRFSAGEGVGFNGAMAPGHIVKHCALDRDGQEMLQREMDGLRTVARNPILRIARTVAVLAGAESVQPEHIAEVARYRALDRKQQV